MDLETSLQELLKLAGMGNQPPTPENVHTAVEKLRMLIRQLGSQQSHAPESARPSGGGGKAAEISALSTQGMGAGGRRVLIVGQLGIVIHQLKQTLVKLGTEVDLAQDMNEAIAQYQKSDYGTVVLDLFMPTEREGMMVLDEIRRLSLLCNINTTVIVLATPSKDKNLRDLCKSKGAAVFLTKTEGWHKQVMELFTNPDKAVAEED